MGIETIIAFGIGLIMGSLNPIFNLWPNVSIWTFILGVVCVVGGCIASWIREKSDKFIPARKIYLSFLKFMKKAGEKLKKKSYLDDKKKMPDHKHDYFNWRSHLCLAIEFVFKKRQDEYTNTTLLFPELNIEWDEQLKRDLDTIEMIKNLKSLGFSEEFEKAPEKLNEFKEFKK